MEDIDENPFSEIEAFVAQQVAELHDGMDRKLAKVHREIALLKQEAEAKGRQTEELKRRLEEAIKISKDNEQQVATLKKELDTFNNVCAVNTSMQLHKAFKAGIDAISAPSSSESSLVQNSSLPSLPDSHLPTTGEAATEITYRGDSSQTTITATIEPHIRQHLEEFTSPSSSNDKLNADQRAFVRYFTVKYEKQGITDNTVKQCIKEGVKAGLWPDNFQPTEGREFSDYLKETMRNFRKKEIQKIKKDQKRRLCEMVLKSRKQLKCGHSDDDEEEDEN